MKMIAKLSTGNNCEGRHCSELRRGCGLLWIQNGDLGGEEEMRYSLTRGHLGGRGRMAGKYKLKMKMLKHRAYMLISGVSSYLGQEGGR